MRSGYSGPVEVVSIPVRGAVVEVVRPLEPDRLLDDPQVIELNRRDDYMPYWAYFWQGAFLLADEVASWRPSGPKPVRALEIGCGLGLAGLAGLRHGLDQVVFSDQDATALDFVRQSAARNGIGPERYELRVLDWREPPDERFDLILGADVLYERRLVPLVAGLIARMLTTGGEAILAGPYRVATEDFLPTARRLGLSGTEREARSVDERGSPVRGLVHHVRRGITSR